MRTTKVWKLDSPTMCRDFLKQVRFGDKEGVTHFWQADGKKINIDEASDEQILQIAIAAAMDKI